LFHDRFQQDAKWTMGPSNVLGTRPPVRIDKLPSCTGTMNAIEPNYFHPLTKAREQAENPQLASNTNLKQNDIHMCPNRRHQWL
jgi:hypothetical protein